jgi:hypothetical protein
MRKLAVLIALGGVLAVVPAASGQNQPITGACSFPVGFEVAKSNGGTTHVLPTDRAPFPAWGTGQLIVTFTNLDNGHSITVSGSGPGFDQPNVNGFLLRGRTTFVAHQAIGDLPAAGIYLISGPALFTFDDADNLTDVDIRSGVFTNLCDVLAAP